MQATLCKPLRASAPARRVAGRGAVAPRALSDVNVVIGGGERGRGKGAGVGGREGADWRRGGGGRASGGRGVPVRTALPLSSLALPASSPPL